MYSIPSCLSTNPLRYKRLLAPDNVTRPEPELWNYEKEGSYPLVEKCYIHHNVSLNICAVSLRDWYENNTFFFNYSATRGFPHIPLFPWTGGKKSWKKITSLPKQPPSPPLFWQTAYMDYVVARRGHLLKRKKKSIVTFFVAPT